MAKEFSIKHFGNKADQRMFALLPDKVARRVVRKAVNAAAAPVRSALRKNMPKDTGSAKSTVSSKTVTSKDKTNIQALIGWDRKKEKDGKRGGRYAHLIENGFIARDGTLVAGKFPLRRAEQSTKSQSQSKFGTKMGAEIAKEAAKLGAKGRGK